MRIGELRGAGIAAVEAHEGIRELVIELALDGFVIHIVRNGVVDIQKSNLISGDAQSDVLGKSSVDIYLAGYRNALAHQAAVDIAGNELEHILECRPALGGQSNVLAIALVSLSPVKKSQLILSKLPEHFRLLACLIVHFLSHIRSNLSDSLIVFVLLIGLEQIQLGLFLNLDVQVVQLLDRSVACQEVGRAGSEGNDLQVGQTVCYACNRKEVMDHVCALFRIAYRIIRDVALCIAKSQVVGSIQNTAVSIAAAVDQIVLGLLSCCAEHLRSIEMLRKKSLGNFRSEVSKIYAQSVAVILLDVLERVHHVDFALDDCDGTLIDVCSIVLLRVSCYQSFSAVLSKRSGEAVTGNGNNTKLDYRNIVHTILHKVR